MMISFSMGLSISLVACRYLRPEWPIQPAKYRNRKVGICCWWCDGVLGDHQKPTYKDITSMAVFECKAGVRDQVGQAVSAAQQALLGIVVKATLGLFNSGLQGKCGSRVGLVQLQALLQPLDLVLLDLGKRLALGTGGEATDISIGRLHAAKRQHGCESSCSSCGTNLLASLLGLGGADHGASRA